MLHQFDDIVPNGAERIFRQFELEGEHRRAQEQRSLGFQIRFAHVGQGLAALFFTSVLAVILNIAVQAPAVASVLGGATIVGGLAALLHNRKQDRGE